MNEKIEVDSSSEYMDDVLELGCGMDRQVDGIDSGHWFETFRSDLSRHGVRKIEARTGSKEIEREVPNLRSEMGGSAT